MNNYKPPTEAEVVAVVRQLISEYELNLKRHRLIGLVLSEYEGMTVVRKRKDIVNALEFRYPDVASLFPQKPGSIPYPWNLRLGGYQSDQWIIEPGSHVVGPCRDSKGALFRINVADFDNVHDARNCGRAISNISNLEQFLKHGQQAVLVKFITQFADMVRAWGLFTSELSYAVQARCSAWLKDALRSGRIYTS